MRLYDDLFNFWVTFTDTFPRKATSRAYCEAAKTASPLFAPATPSVSMAILGPRRLGV